ncbi:MAG: DMT family transporter [Dehalogenimonas sp.]
MFKSRPHSLRKANIFLATGILVLSSGPVLIKLSETTPLVIAFYRLFFALLLLIPFFVSKLPTVLRSMSWRDRLLITISGIAVAAQVALATTSFSFTSVAGTMILVSVHPVIVAIFSIIFRIDKVPKMAFIGIFVALSGVLIMNRYNIGENILTGNILALLSGLSMAIYLIIGRYTRAKIDVWPYLTIIYLIASLILIIIIMITHQTIVNLPSKTWIMLAIFAIGPQVMGQANINFALRYSSTIVVSISILLVPILAIVWAALVLNEIPQIIEIVGGTVIFLGIILTIIAHNTAIKNYQNVKI